MGAVARSPRPTFTVGVIEQLAAIEQEMGGRSALVGMLVLAPLTPDLKYVLGMLGDPEHRGLSLAAICAKGNILPGDLLTHLASAAVLRGKVRASQSIARGIGAVADDVMRRAAPYEDTCNGGCRGVGTITPEPTPAVPNPSPVTCETCLGTGRLMYQPDLERQKIAIEMAQLLPKGGGLNIALQQNNTSGGGGQQQGLSERLQMLSDKILYGSGERPPMDGEEIPDEPDAGRSEPEV